MRKTLGALLVLASLVTPAAPAFAYHDDDGYCYEEEQCEGYGYYDGDYRGDRYDQDYGSYDRNRNRNRNRGAFSPGPFDRSPLDFRNACISLDCSNRDRDPESRRDDQRDGEREQRPGVVTPQSLFPPTPDGIRAFVVNTIKGGIEMGRLFAETTIKFVEDLMVGIA
jgi:hypothetical protein